MEDASRELDEEARRLAAETDARDLRVRELQSTIRRLRDEAVDLVMCASDLRLLQEASPVSLASNRQRMH